MADDAASSRTWVRDLVVLLVAAVVGAGIFWLVTRDTGPSGPDIDVDIPEATATSGDTAPVVAAGQGADAPAVAPEDATDPETAVTTFLAAEVNRDFATSYALLDTDTRTRVGTLPGWTNAHADFPRIVGFEVTGVDGDIVTTNLALDSRLDPVLGLVPSAATATWETVAGPDGVRVDFDDSVLTPVYPDDAPSRGAALAWATALQAGEDATALEGVRSLAGRAGFRDLVAESTGDFDAGEPFVLPPDGGNSGLLSRFGAGVVEWGRAVTLTGPVDVTVVLAPVAGDWVVIGLIDP